MVKGCYPANAAAPREPKLEQLEPPCDHDADTCQIEAGSLFP